MQPHVVFVFFSVFSLSIGLIQSMRLTVNPSYAVIGDMVTIVCELSKSESYDVVRIHRGGMAVFSAFSPAASCKKSKPDFRPSFQKGIKFFKVLDKKVIIRLKAGVTHTGRYSCRFLDGINDYNTKVKVLTVGKPASLDKFTLSPAEVLHGKEIVAECIADKGIPEGRLWIKDSNNKVIGGVETTVTSADGTPLTKLTTRTKAPMEKVGETFHCQTENIFNRKRADIKVKSVLSASTIIYHPPNTVEILPKRKYYKNGDELICNARGYPRPSFKWLVNASSVIHKKKGDTLKLTLSPDLTRISCIAENMIKKSKYSERKVIWFTKKDGKFIRMNTNPDLDITTINEVTTSETSTAPMVTTEKQETTTAEKEHSRKPHKKDKQTTTTESSTDQSTTTEAQETTRPNKKQTDAPSTSGTTTADITTRESTTEMAGTTKDQGITALPVKDNSQKDKENKRYEKVMLYLKLSIALNLVFGVVIMFFLIGLCLRISNYLK